MRANPMRTAGNRTIDHQYGASIGGLDDRIGRFSLRYSGRYFRAIFLRIVANAAGRKAVADKINKLATGFCEGGWQAIHFHEAGVAQHQPLRGIEHHETLRHIADGGGIQCASPAVQPSKKYCGPESCQNADGTGGNNEKPPGGGLTGDAA